MNTCDAYADWDGPECELQLHHEGPHMATWANDEYSTPFVGPRLPHVHSDHCEALCQTLEHYTEALTDHFFSAKPFLVSFVDQVE